MLRHQRLHEMAIDGVTTCLFPPPTELIIETDETPDYIFLCHSVISRFKMCPNIFTLLTALTDNSLTALIDNSLNANTLLRHQLHQRCGKLHCLL